MAAADQGLTGGRKEKGKEKKNPKEDVKKTKRDCCFLDFDLIIVCKRNNLDLPNCIEGLSIPHIQIIDNIIHNSILLRCL